MKHIYLVANCKTPGCGTACVLKYLGEDIGQEEIAEFEPTGFQYECGNCQTPQRFDLVDLYPAKMDEPPPPGWSNGF